MTKRGYEERKAHVAAWRESELELEVYAEQIGVRPRTLQHWRWEVALEEKKRCGDTPRTSRRRTRSGSVEPGFADVTALVDEGASSGVEVVAGDRIVRVGPHFDDETLRRVLSVLEDA